MEHGRPLCFCPVVSSFFLFCPRLIVAVADWMSTYYHTCCGLSANLGCRSETCCTRLAENTGCKKVAQNRHLGTIAQLCRAISSQLRHVSTIGKNLLSSNISSTCPHNMVKKCGPMPNVMAALPNIDGALCSTPQSLG